MYFHSIRNYQFLAKKSGFTVNSILLFKYQIVLFIYEPVHEISSNVVYATSKSSDQPALTRSLIRAIACRLGIL